MSIETEISRLNSAKAAIVTAIMEKGVTVPSGTKLDGMAKLIESIPEAKDPILQEKNVTPATASQSVIPDSGYDGLSKVTVDAMPTATQATPSITVSSAGLITASATQTAGYVAAGTKSATKQLTTQGAQIITPGTADKSIALGRYLTGTQTIKGDSNLVAANIASGVSIFGVIGTYSGGSGGGEACTLTVSGMGATAAVQATGADGGIISSSKDITGTLTLSLMKNSIFYIYWSMSGVSSSGGVTRVYQSGKYYVGRITADGSVNYNGDV